MLFTQQFCNINNGLTNQKEDEKWMLPEEMVKFRRIPGQG